MARVKHADRKASGVDGLLRPPQKTCRAAVQRLKEQQLARTKYAQARKRKARKKLTQRKRSANAAAHA